MSLRGLLEAAAVSARNLVLGGNLAAASLVASPWRMLHYVSESLFLYRAVSGRRGLPERTVPQALGGCPVEAIRLGNLHGETWLGPVASYTADLASLCLLCRILEPRIVFEIGTFNGYTSYHFALNTPDDSVIYTLDLPMTDGARPALPTTFLDDRIVQAAARDTRRCFEGTDVERKIRCLEGDSAAFDYEPYRGRVDFFFIDGAHSYDYVRSDTRRALECCRPGGVIAWHDFGRMGVNGVTRHLLELRRAGYDVCSVPGGSVAFLVVPGPAAERPAPDPVRPGAGEHADAR